MNYLLLTVTVLGCVYQNIAKKDFSKKTGGKGCFLFSAVSAFSALLFFAFSGGELSFNIQIVPYSLCFGIAYMTSVVFVTIAIAIGSVSLTSLITSYSLLIPSLYGLIFLNEPIGKGLIPGLLFLAFSLFLINQKDDSKGVSVSFKWITAVFLTFVGNGMCSTVQKMQQVRFDGAYKNEFMIIALVFVTVASFIAVLIKERKEVHGYSQKTLWIAFICGVVNGLVNLLVMIISGSLPAAVMFPLISGGSIILTFLIAKFYYKEKMSFKQMWGLCLGVISVVLLNI